MAFRRRRARWWNHRARAWCRRRHWLQRRWWGTSWMVRLSSRYRCLISLTVNAVTSMFSGGWSSPLVGSAGGGAVVAAWAAVIAQTARAAIVKTMWPASGVEADLGLVEPEVVLAELEIFLDRPAQARHGDQRGRDDRPVFRSEEHTSELQSRGHLVCR